MEAILVAESFIWACWLGNAAGWAVGTVAEFGRALLTRLRSGKLGGVRSLDLLLVVRGGRLFGSLRLRRCVRSDPVKRFLVGRGVVVGLGSG